MHLRAEGDGVFNRQARVQRGIAVLEHHLHLAAKFLERQIARTHGAAIKDQLALGRVHQVHEQACGGGFTAAGLAHHAQGFTLEHFKVHAIDGMHRGTVFQREVLGQTTHDQQWLRGAAYVLHDSCVD